MIEKDNDAAFEPMPKTVKMVALIPFRPKDEDGKEYARGETFYIDPGRAKAMEKYKRAVYAEE